MASDSTSEAQTQQKLALWLKDFLRRLKEFTDTKHAPAETLDACYRFEMENIEPILMLWATDPNLTEATTLLRAVARDLEAWSKAHDSGRGGRDLLRNLWAGAYKLKFLMAPAEGEGEQNGARLYDVPWHTRLTDSGEILFDAGAGHVVPLSGELTDLAWPKVMAEVARGMPSYPEKVRPLDVLGRPGGLLHITDATRLLVIGDIHGRYANLEAIFRDKENLRELKRNKTNILFLGDVIHPGHAESDDKRKGHADSFRVLFLILSLKAELPERVHYLIGNHENAHLGGLGAAKAEESEHHAFQTYIRRHLGDEVLSAYLKFLASAPVIAKFEAPGGNLLFIHGGPSNRISSEQGMIDITAGGRRGKGLNDILWNRHFEPEVIDAFLEATNSTFVICGHTRPVIEAAAKYGYKVLADKAFGVIAGKLLLLNSQGSTFGYLDIDLTKPLPPTVDALKAPNGAPAFRLFKPREE